jgi:beta-mannosidase
MGGLQRLTLNENWQWRLANSNGNPKAEALYEKLAQWTPVAAFPSVIQMELFANGTIPDYNVGENERLVQWVGEADWAYCTSFPTPSVFQPDAAVDLVFDGLDTFATVTLNGIQILTSDNMFIPSRVDLKGCLRDNGEQNELSILFESAVKKGAELESTWGKKKSRLGDAKRNYIRKAQVRDLMHTEDHTDQISVSLGMGLGPCHDYCRPLHANLPGDLPGENQGCLRDY